MILPGERVTVVVPSAVSVPTGEPMLRGTVLGNSGCLAAACHGGPAVDLLAGRFDENTPRSSGTCWNAADPHTRAFSLLTDRPHRPVRVSARRIMEGLHSPIPATEDVRCLACHTNPSSATATDFRSRALRSEGVGCESCHGNAGGWIREHTTWTGDRREVYRRTGMTPLFDLGERAMTCLGCHVGASADPVRQYPVRDMNHDMIAAGHPRLSFDLGEFHRVLPKHWREQDRSPGMEAKLWLVGRVAHAEAVCRLLADRADRAAAADTRTPWPELSEFDCASCHHDLPQSWRRGETVRGVRAPGSLRGQTVWPVLVAEPIDAFQPLVTIMRKKRPAGYGEVGPIASESASKLEEMRQKLVAASDAEVWAFFRSATSRITPDPDWDVAGQLMWGLAAFGRAGRINQPTRRFDQAFDALRRRDWDSARPALEALLGSP